MKGMRHVQCQCAAVSVQCVTVSHGSQHQRAAAAAVPLLWL